MSTNTRSGQILRIWSLVVWPSNVVSDGAIIWTLLSIGTHAVLAMRGSLSSLSSTSSLYTVLTMFTWCSNAWSAEENRLLLHRYEQFGSSWAEISQGFVGRPDNACVASTVCSPLCDAPFCHCNMLCIAADAKINGTSSLVAVSCAAWSAINGLLPRLPPKQRGPALLKARLASQVRLTVKHRAQGSSHHLAPSCQRQTRRWNPLH